MEGRRRLSRPSFVFGGGLKQFDSVAEGIIHVESFETGQIGVWLDNDACERQTLLNCGEIGDPECDVGFPGGDEIWIDPEMKFDRTSAEPESASAGECLGFGEFLEPEKMAVKPPRLFFSVLGDLRS